MVAANIPFTNPTIRPLGVFSLSLFAIVIAKAIRPIIAHKVIVDEVKANNNRAIDTSIPPVYFSPLATSLLFHNY